MFQKAFRWNPEVDTYIALASAALMIPVYWLNNRFNNPGMFALFVIVGNLLLSVALPAYVVLWQRGEGLSQLGITRRRLLLSLIISIVLAALLAFPFFQVANAENIDWLPHLLFNGLVFWEVMFVYGWLQLRFERAFGWVVAPLLAAACFAAYHIGSATAAEVGQLAVIGVVYGFIFMITRNLLILFPLTWAFSSGMGSLTVGFVADWATVIQYVIIVAVQVGIIYYLFNNRPKSPQFKT